MRWLALLFAIATLIGGVAGCIGADETDETVDPSSVADDDPAPTLEQPNVTIDDGEKVYAWGEEDHREVRWENDSFSPASCFACPDGEHRYDVTPMLADGSPTLLQAEVETDTNVFDATFVSIQADGAEIYQHNGSFQEAEAVVAPQGGTVEVVVEASFPDANTEIAYELRIEAHANRSAVPSQVPVAFPAPEDPAGLVVDGGDLEEQARLMLWDGEDTFLGHHPVEDRTVVNLTEAEGDELVAFLAGAGPVRLAPVNASAQERTLRPLATVTETAGANVASDDVVEVETEIDPVPLQAGLFLEGNNDAGTSYSGELAVDGETVTSFESGGYLTGSETRFIWWGEPGARALVDAPYVGTFDFSAATGGEAGVVWTSYER